MANGVGLLLDEVGSNVGAVELFNLAEKELAKSFLLEVIIFPAECVRAHIICMKINGMNTTLRNKLILSQLSWYDGIN